MKRAICGLCVAVLALALAASASAKAPHHPSDLFFVDSDTIGDTIWVVGGVESSAKCTAKRTVKISYDYDDGEGFVPVDVAKTSQSGFFGGAGPAEQNGNTANVAKFVLAEKTYTKGGQKHVCEGDKLVVD